jgi:hypothetical protein
MALENAVHCRGAASSDLGRSVWVLAFPTGAMLTAPIRFDDDGEPVFSLPKAQLLVHVALRDCDPTEMDFRLLPEGGLEIDLGNVVIDRH